MHMYFGFKVEAISTKVSCLVSTSGCPWPSDTVKSCASTPPPPAGFCFTIWFPQQRQRKKTRDRTSCLKTRESRNRKKEILILISSNQDLSSLLFSSLLFFSSLLCPPPPLLSPTAAQRSSSRPHSPVLGTKERPCPFHPCRGSESRLAFCDRPGPTPPTVGPVGGNPGVRECRAGPDRPSVTDPSSVTDRQEN